MPAGPYHDALRELEELERSLSRERTRLQDRIDFVRGTDTTDETVAEQLRRLEEREHEVSERRRALHRQIDSARAREAS
jgi:hypothetical protein